MKVKYYTKMMIPLCLFGILFRVLEIFFAVEPETSLYKVGSIIPIMFNLFSFLVVLFIASALFSVPKGKKEVSRRLSGFSPLENIIFIITAVFMLTSGMKEFVFGFLDKSYKNFSDIIKSPDLYIFIFSFFAALFIVQIVSSPKRTTRSNFWTGVSLTLPIYYVLALFAAFTATESIIIHVYSSYEIIKLAVFALALLNFAKIFIGSFNRRFFIVFSHMAIYFTAIRFADLILYFIPSDKYNISINPLQQICDVFLCIVFVIVLMKVSKKVKNPDSFVRVTENRTEE